MDRGAKPDREYWEKREARRETTIFLQVAFKAAVELQAANVRAGNPFNRDNLYYDVRPKQNVIREIIKYVKQNSGKSGIVYCLSRKPPSTACCFAIRSLTPLRASSSMR